MFGSDIIDAALGLILVFSLFSLLCSAINEWVAGHVLRLRAKTLEDAIKRMLADDAMATDFFGLPLIKSLTQKDEGRPAYLSSGTFVNGLLTLVKSEAKKAGLDDAAIKQAGLDADQLRAVLEKINAPKVKSILQSLLSGTKDMTEARQKLEGWFNESMDRATGWYKKRTNIFMAVWALLVVGAFNVDTFTITRTLLSNSRLRASLVAAAEETAKQTPSTDNKTNSQQAIGEIEKKIKSLELPIGWPTGTNAIRHDSGSWLEKLPLRQYETCSMKIGGLLVTAFALSFGAPFWFDLLNRLVNLRAAGKKPAADEDKKK